MKLVLLFAVILASLALATAVPTLSSHEVRSLFSIWASNHKKVYSHEDEINHRLKAFTENLAFVQKHNAEAAQGKHTFTVAMNRFADLTNAEFRRQYLGYRRGPNANSTAPRLNPNLKSSDLPDTVDWRTKGVITAVKDQGQCGSCWSFSAVGSMEAANALSTGNLVSLSEQNLIDCVKDGTYTCDTGGWMDDGFDYVINQAKGIDTEDNYPYCTCSGNSCSYDSSASAATFSSYFDVASGSEDDLQTASATYPGISVAIDASHQSFQLYSSGVYSEDACSSSSLDHGVLVVGYGSDSGSDYWLVKNSWSDTWGMDGYIMMTRNQGNQCGIATDASYIVV
jgi:cathepsin L